MMNNFGAGFVIGQMIGRNRQPLFIDLKEDSSPNDVVEMKVLSVNKKDTDTGWVSTTTVEYTYRDGRKKIVTE